jgi:hypothetical protein
LFGRGRHFPSAPADEAVFDRFGDPIHLKNTDYVYIEGSSNKVVLAVGAGVFGPGKAAFPHDSAVANG